MRVYLSGLMSKANDIFTDAWLLLSIALKDGPDGVDLRGIIAAGDYINHAIFTEDELRGGLFRLTRTGCISQVNSRYHLVGRANEIREELMAACPTVAKSLDRFSEFLKTELYAISDIPVGNCSDLTNETVRRAYRDYQKNWGR
jgi:hypothetical protein